jgi:hypothetical protein
MERITFEEVKQLKHKDLFWSGNDKFVVTSDAKHINTSNFYGDYSQTIEWTAQSTTTLRESTFQISNTKIPNAPSDPMIYRIES